MLKEQLSDQIEQEAESNTLHFKDVNDYDAGRIGGYKEGYEAAGVKYAALWQEAEQRAERAEKALEEILGLTPYSSLAGDQRSETMREIATDALTPKTSEDGR